MQKTTLYAPEDLERELKDAARREGRPMAELVRDALRRYLSERGRSRPHSIGMAADGEVGGANSEEWLRGRWGDRSTH
ncbi:MAG: ribbon-helix-helix protein, CopG family [Actinomycetota bacterium]